jgi:hypothetical protein
MPRSRRSLAISTTKVLAGVVPVALHQQTQRRPTKMPSPCGQISGMAGHESCRVTRGKQGRGVYPADLTRATTRHPGGNPRDAARSGLAPTGCHHEPQRARSVADPVVAQVGDDGAGAGSVPGGLSTGDPHTFQGARLSRGQEASAVLRDDPWAVVVETVVRTLWAAAGQAGRRGTPWTVGPG